MKRKGIVECSLVMLFLIGVLVAGSEADTIWPWNCLAGAAMMVAAFLGFKVYESKKSSDYH